MNDDSLFDDLKYIQYTLSLPAKLKERLESHLQRLKHLQDPQSVRQFWLLCALQEKLHKEEEILETSGTKHLNVALPQGIVEQINVRLALSPQTLTKKKWILEAIEEKLEADRILIQTKQARQKKTKITKKSLITTFEE